MSDAPLMLSVSGLRGLIGKSLTPPVAARYAAAFGEFLKRSRPQANGAPMSLDSLAALRAPAPSDPSRSNAELSVVRMSSVSNPMPPAPAAAVPSTGRDLFSSMTK